MKKCETRKKNVRSHWKRQIDKWCQWLIKTLCHLKFFLSLCVSLALILFCSCSFLVRLFFFSYRYMRFFYSSLCYLPMKFINSKFRLSGGKKFNGKKDNAEKETKEADKRKRKSLIDTKAIYIRIGSDFSGNWLSTILPDFVCYVKALCAFNWRASYNSLKQFLTVVSI